MPTYDYECDACGHQFELFQRISDEPLKTCPDCGKEEKIRRLFGTGAAIVFKGSGFYQTDYRSQSYKSAAEKESKDGAPKSDSKTESKTPSDGKPAASTGETAKRSPKPKPKPDKSSD